MANSGDSCRNKKWRPGESGRHKIVLILVLSLFTVLLFPYVALSDCVDLGRSTAWHIQDEHTIFFYAGMRFIASVNVPSCSLNSSSMVRLIKNYVCDGDKILVDDTECSIMEISSAATGPD